MAGEIRADSRDEQSTAAPQQPDPASASEPRWERRKEARPQELLDAALELFVEKGYAATRLEDVRSEEHTSELQSH